MLFVSVVNVKGVLLDLDGTLYAENIPIAGAREAIVRLEEAGIPYRYVTNTTRKPRQEVIARLSNVGFPVREGAIFAPAVAANVRLSGRTCYPLVAEALLEDLDRLEFVSRSPEYVLMGDLGEGFTYARLDAAFRHLTEGAELVALQKNRYWEREDGLSLDAGPFVAALEYASGKTALVIGKPEPAFFEAALRSLGLKARDVVMVGDDAESDVSGAQRAGLLGIQVKTGKYQPGMTAEPDAEVESVALLPEILGL